jgi:hypothetical protein
MTSVFVVKNQLGQYLNKQQEWVDGSDSHTLLRTPHRDEAINTVFEVSSRDIYLRAEAIACELDAKGNPIVDSAPAESVIASEEIECDPENENPATNDLTADSFLQEDASLSP